MYKHYIYKQIFKTVLTLDAIFICSVVGNLIVYIMTIEISEIGHDLVVNNF